MEGGGVPWDPGKHNTAFPYEQSGEGGVGSSEALMYVGVCAG